MSLRVLLICLFALFTGACDFALRGQDKGDTSLQRVPDVFWLEPHEWISTWQQSHGKVLQPFKSRVVLLIVIGRSAGFETIAVIRDNVVNPNSNPFDEAKKNRPLRLSLCYLNGDSRIIKGENEVKQTQLKQAVGDAWNLVADAGMATQEANLVNDSNEEWNIVCREPEPKDHFKWSRGGMAQAINPRPDSKIQILRSQILRFGGIKDTY